MQKHHYVTQVFAVLIFVHDFALKRRVPLIPVQVGANTQYNISERNPPQSLPDPDSINSEMSEMSRKTP